MAQQASQYAVPEEGVHTTQDDASRERLPTVFSGETWTETEPPRTPQPQRESVLAMVRAGWRGFVADCRRLETSPRELYTIFIMIMCTAFTYNTMANIMTVFASAEYGYDDIETAEIYGTWGLMSALWAMLLGPLIDVIGVRMSGVIGFSIYAVARMLVVFVDDKQVFKWTVILLSPIAEGLAGLSSSMYGLAIKRYTTTASRNFAYALLSSILNLGGAVAGFAIDYLTGTSWNLGILGVDTPLSGMRFTLLMGLASNMVCLVLAFTLRPIQIADEEPSSPSTSEAKPAAGGAAAVGTPDESTVTAKGASSSTAAAGAQTTNPLDVLRQVVSAPNFGRFFWMMMLLCAIQTEWHHNAATLPKYLIRENGDSVPYGSIASINWMIAAVLPPIVQSVLSGMGHYDIITLGCWVMGVAPLIMVFGTSQSVLAACLWNVVFTLGEVLWSPRTDTLAAQIAPEGLEATFFSLSAAPTFLAKWPTGVFSGWLLTTFVPECNRCMDNHGLFCSAQPQTGEFFSTERTGERCFSRFNCAGNSTGTLNGLDFSCPCGAAVTPEQPADWCRTSCDSLSPASGLAKPGLCPSTCYDCEGWSSDPVGMWTVITISTVLTPAALSLFRRWLEPQNPDGSPMQMGDETKDWSAFSYSTAPQSDAALAAQEEQEDNGEHSAEKTAPSTRRGSRRYRAPLGARLCDRLCFARTLRELEAPLNAAVNQPQEQQEEQQIALAGEESGLQDTGAPDNAIH